MVSAVGFSAKSLPKKHFYGNFMNCAFEEKVNGKNYTFEGALSCHSFAANVPIGLDRPLHR